MTGVDKRHGDAEKTAPFSLFLRGNDAFKLSLKIKINLRESVNLALTVVMTAQEKIKSI